MLSEAAKRDHESDLLRPVQLTSPDNRFAGKVAYHYFDLAYVEYASRKWIPKKEASHVRRKEREIVDATQHLYKDLLDRLNAIVTPLSESRCQARMSLI